MTDEKFPSPLLITGARVVRPHGVVGDAGILVEDGRIAQRLTDESELPLTSQTLDLKGLTLFPGFIDVHIHGAVGVDVLAAGVDELQEVARYLATQGVTAWLPTLVPAPDEEYGRAARVVGELMRVQEDKQTPPAARALGLHYEGPFVNSAQCGALRTAYFKVFDNPAQLNALAMVKHESVTHLITLAPEIEGGIELVGELRRRGFVVSIGHTRAEVETLDAAFAAGARHMTHFFNAMTPLHHRRPGPVGWGLMRDAVTCDIIADGVHADPLMLALALRCKTAERLVLISDAVAPAGLGDGEFQMWGETITVTDRRTSNERGSIAGSVISLRDAVRMMLGLGVPEHEVAQMASLNPARLLGIDDRCGSIEEGKRADLAALDDEGTVQLTLVGGRIAFDAR
ncbi:MAG: N-acetylglucosamine-6-phosphate deacetylase [Acidobacteriota bacterium]|nr:N-acetylglucosamine-6-phosphate deacetylase [Acidobacteriota bacterium]